MSAAIAHTPPVMSGGVESSRPSSPADIESALRTLHDAKERFLGLSLRERSLLLRACMKTTQAVAADWVRAACEAKGLSFDAPEAGEEWLAGPYFVVRNLRLLAETLEALDRGSLRLGTGARTRTDGRVEIDLFPTSVFDALLYRGFTGHALLQPGVTEADARARQAPLYRAGHATAGVSLVLGAGNVSSIAPMDALQKLFAEGRVVLVKMNPVNEYLGPFIERALSPLVERGFLRVLYGGGPLGSQLCADARVDDIHITGSDRTHDLIVWGAPGPERERRRRENDPLLRKPITSELGNVSPVIVVPGPYTDAELSFVARNIATQVTNNASFNCNAAKMLVLPKGWARARALVEAVAGWLRQVPPRKAYYPGAADRYRTLTDGRKVTRLGEAGEGRLPWTIIEGLDPATDDAAFTTEPFCGLLNVVELPETEPARFLDAAVAFANDRLWGTLNACLFVHPKSEREEAIASAVDRAVVNLRYGTVGINHWPALGYGLVSLPWGGHPSATLSNVQSGLGWVHNSYLIEGIDKAVVRGPLKPFPTPAWFMGHRTTHVVGRRLVDFEAAPSWLKLPVLVGAAIRG